MKARRRAWSESTLGSPIRGFNFAYVATVKVNSLPMIYFYTEKSNTGFPQTDALQSYLGGNQMQQEKKFGDNRDELLDYILAKMLPTSQNPKIPWWEATRRHDTMPGSLTRNKPGRI